MTIRRWSWLLLACAVAAFAFPIPPVATVPSHDAALTAASATAGLPLCIVSKNPAPEKPDATPLWFLSEDGTACVVCSTGPGPRPSAGERRLITSHLVYTLITSSRL